MNESTLIEEMRKIRSALEMSGRLFAKRLKESENKLNESDESYNGPHVAAYSGDIHYLIPFLHEGGLPEYPNNGGFTLLHTAADAWQHKIVELLVLFGAEVNAQDNNGETAFHALVKSQKIPFNGRFLENRGPEESRKLTFKELHIAGGNVEIRNIQGASAVHLAADWGDFDALVSLLTPRRESIDARTEKGATALSLAILREHIDCVKLLISLGADTNTQLKVDGLVFTPRHLLYNSENPELRELFDYKPSGE